MGNIAHRIVDYLLWFPESLNVLFVVSLREVSLVVPTRIAVDCGVNIKCLLILAEISFMNSLHLLTLDTTSREFIGFKGKKLDAVL